MEHWTGSAVMTKPSDFFLGVMDFFGVLLPGAALVYLIQPAFINVTFTLWSPHTESQGWVLFLVLAYIAGHLLQAIGGDLLDKRAYEKWFLPKEDPNFFAAKKAVKNCTDIDENSEAAKTLLARVDKTKTVDPTGSHYDWCLSYLRLYGPAGAIEVDRNQGNSKFFRSMALVFFVGTIVGTLHGLTLIRPGTYFLAAFTIALSIFGGPTMVYFSILRYCKLRLAATNRLYEYYLLLHELAQDNGAPTCNDQREAPG
jgi:hypothetical protein